MTRRQLVQTLVAASFIASCTAIAYWRGDSPAGHRIYGSLFASAAFLSSSLVCLVFARYRTGGLLQKTISILILSFVAYFLTVPTRMNPSMADHIKEFEIIKPAQDSLMQYDATCDKVRFTNYSFGSDKEIYATITGTAATREDFDIMRRTVYANCKAIRSIGISWNIDFDDGSPGLNRDGA